MTDFGYDIERVNAVAQAIRYADGNHTLGAAALAEVAIRAVDAYDEALRVSSEAAINPFGRFTLVRPDPCPNGPHRAPQGPNEDISQCGICWMPTFAMRPPDETFGHHLPDCSLPRRHESYCKPGGKGHPDAKVIRG